MHGSATSARVSGVPVIVAQLLRSTQLRQGGQPALNRTLGPLSVGAAGDAVSTVRSAGRTDPAPAGRHCPIGRADDHSVLLSTLVELPVKCAAARCWCRLREPAARSVSAG